MYQEDNTWTNMEREECTEKNIRYYGTNKTFYIRLISRNKRNLDKLTGTMVTKHRIEEKQNMKDPIEKTPEEIAKDTDKNSGHPITPVTNDEILTIERKY
jgi:hypothetical protein